MTSLSILLRQLLPAVRMLLVMTLVCGVLYPLAVTAAARLVPGRAQGQVVEVDGRPVGSALIGQQLEGERWFRGRPSASDAAGDTSGGSNLAVGAPEQLAAVAERRAAVARDEGVDPSDVPDDAVTASGSGLDPHISPAYAALQVPRVARTTGLTETEVADLVGRHTDRAPLGLIGQDGVAITPLNAELARRTGRG